MARASAIFDADDARMLAAMKRIDKQLMEVQGKFAKFFNVLKGGFALAGVGMAIGKVMDGVKAQFEIGDELQNMHMQTGISVEDLVKLRKEFKHAGLEANDVAPVMAKMMKAIETGSASNVISQMGFDLQKFKSLSPAEQFTQLGKAINALPTAQQRATAAMEIFGKSGARLLAVFGAKGFGDDSAELGAQAKIMGENAAVFKEITEDLEMVGNKIKGLWLGMAAEIAPVLLPILEQLKGFNFLEFGKGLGDSVAIFLEAFNAGKLGDFVGDTITYSLLNAANAFYKAMIAVIQAIGDSMKFALFTDGKKSFEFGKSFDKHYKENGDVGGMKEFNAQYNQLGNGIAKSLAAHQANARTDAKESNTGLGEGIDLEAQHANVTALARVGGAYGGGGGDPLLDENRRQTGYLSTIAAGISKLTIPGVHVASGNQGYL